MNLKNILKEYPLVVKTYKHFRLAKNGLLLYINPKIVANTIYKRVFKKNVNWEKPEDLIEKILWLQFYSDTRLWTLCADKFLVRKYVKEKYGSEILNELYGKWDHPNEINWSDLPDNFILKINNSCGHIIKVKNKQDLNTEKINRQLLDWLKSGYGFRSAQMHYTRIKPCIIAEKLLEQKGSLFNDLVDFKIWCFHGKPEFVLVAYNRSKENYSLSAYDLDWNNISDKVLNKNSRHYNGMNIPKPKSLQKILEISRRLSEGFPQVRVDFYEIDSKPVFGELTFTTGFGSLTPEYYKYLGSKIDLKKVEKKPMNNSVSLKQIFRLKDGF